MKPLETHLNQHGLTTVPKALRAALGAEEGGRLVWQLQADGTLRVSLKHAYRACEHPTERRVVRR